MSNQIQTTEKLLISKRAEILALDRELSGTCDPEVADAAVRMILGAYPNRKAVDADAYVTQIAALLEAYPTEIVQQCCDPRAGIQTKHPFLPSLSEIKELLEELVAPTRDRLRWKRNELERLHYDSRKVQFQIEDRKYEATPEERGEAVKRWEETKANMQLAGLDKRAEADKRRKALFERARCQAGESIRHQMENER